MEGNKERKEHVTSSPPILIGQELSLQPLICNVTPQIQQLENLIPLSPAHVASWNSPALTEQGMYSSPPSHVVAPPSQEWTSHQLVSPSHIASSITITSAPIGRLLDHVMTASQSFFAHSSQDFANLFPLLPLPPVTQSLALAQTLIGQMVSPPPPSRDFTPFQDLTNPYPLSSPHVAPSSSPTPALTGQVMSHPPFSLLSQDSENLQPLSQPSVALSLAHVPTRLDQVVSPPPQEPIAHVIPQSLNLCPLSPSHVTRSLIVAPTTIAQVVSLAPPCSNVPQPQELTNLIPLSIPHVTLSPTPTLLPFGHVVSSAPHFRGVPPSRESTKLLPLSVEDVARSLALASGLVGQVESRSPQPSTTQVTAPLPPREQSMAPARISETPNIRRGRRQPRNYGPYGSLAASAALAHPASPAHSPATTPEEAEPLAAPEQPVPSTTPAQHALSIASLEGQVRRTMRSFDSTNRAWIHQQENIDGRDEHPMGNSNIMPYFISIDAGEDVISRIISFAQQVYQRVSILSAKGTISIARISRPDSPGGTIILEGLYNLLCLNGSFAPSGREGSTRSGQLTVSLGSPGGRVEGGVVSLLIAATPMQIVIATHPVEDQPRDQTSAGMPAGSLRISSAGPRSSNAPTFFGVSSAMPPGRSN